LKVYAEVDALVKGIAGRASVRWSLKWINAWLSETRRLVSMIANIALRNRARLLALVGCQKIAFGSRLPKQPMGKTGGRGIGECGVKGAFRKSWNAGNRNEECSAARRDWAEVGDFTAVFICRKRGFPGRFAKIFFGLLKSCFRGEGR
jgi:hypothetical protein